MVSMRFWDTHKCTPGVRGLHKPKVQDIYGISVNRISLNTLEIEGTLPYISMCIYEGP